MRIRQMLDVSDVFYESQEVLLHLAGDVSDVKKLRRGGVEFLVVRAGVCRPCWSREQHADADKHCRA